MKYKKKIVYVDTDKKSQKQEKEYCLVILLVLSCLINISMAYGLVNSITFAGKGVTLKKIWKAKQFKKLVTEGYYKDISQDELIEGCIKGMTAVMDDPYTEYFSKNDMEKFKLVSDGKFKGIGISMYIDNDRIINIHQVMKNTPAERVGIRAGDKILCIDGKDVTNVLYLQEVADLISDSGDSVNIEILRPSTNEKIKFVVDIEEIQRETINSKMLENDIGYIGIVIFDEKADKEFEKHLTNLKKKGMKGLVLDLRDNPGGSYEAVVNIANMLVPKYKVVVYTEDRYKRQEVEHSKGPGIDVPIVVLVNENSASASEILAGALKYNNGALLVGNKTYGKGLVQRIQDFIDGSGLKMTISRYFTPNGECIQDKGIEPDYKINLPEKYLNNIASQVPKEEDTQFIQAVKILRDKIN